MRMHPSIILIRPQMGENIGSSARAMANFGLRDLRLVAPRDGWPNAKASDTAGKALDILDDAQLFATTREAVADCQFVLATTARSRAVNMPALYVRDAVAELRMRVARGERCAVLFGPERTGLENEDIACAHAVVTIPVAGEYTSLNLAQAVVVVASEWFQTQTPPPLVVGEEPAPQAELHAMFDQLEQVLETAKFWRTPEKKDSIWRNVRAVFTRAGMSAQEVATWRGIIRAFGRE